MVGRVLSAASFVALFVACASPTLPLPPPMDPTVEMGSDADHVELVEQCGGSESDAIIQIINTNPSLNSSQFGTLARANGCGAWQAEVYAHMGDVLEITQEIGNTTSQELDFQVTLPQ